MSQPQPTVVPKNTRARSQATNSVLCPPDTKKAKLQTQQLEDASENRLERITYVPPPHMFVLGKQKEELIHRWQIML